MKTINGEKISCSMVVEFDFTKAEADRFLAARPEIRPQLIQELLSTKHPNHEPHGGAHASSQFLEAIGKAMVQWRENELKQLPEFSGGNS